jgi:proteic killer suppression protein
MDIIFKSKKLEKQCNDFRILVRQHGQTRARKLRQRLDDLLAASSLAEVSKLPPARCHELVGDRAGQLSIDLDHPYRLILIPANDPTPLKEDGGLDWSKVTAIEIQGIEDTHE